MKMALCLSFIFLGNLFNIELAITEAEQSLGYMYRTQWDNDYQGMLFINDTERQACFWMKNTHLNLIILYLDSSFAILERHIPIPLSENVIASTSDRVKYILELNPRAEPLIMKNWSEFRLILGEELKKKEHDIREVNKILLQ